MAKELTEEELVKNDLKQISRFVGTPDEFEFVGMEEDIQVIEIEE